MFHNRWITCSEYFNMILCCMKVTPLLYLFPSFCQNFAPRLFPIPCFSPKFPFTRKAKWDRRKENCFINTCMEYLTKIWKWKVKNWEEERTFSKFQTTWQVVHWWMWSPLFYHHCGDLCCYKYCLLWRLYVPFTTLGHFFKLFNP